MIGLFHDYSCSAIQFFDSDHRSSIPLLLFVSVAAAAVFGREIHQITKSAANIIICALRVRNHACTAILDIIFGVPEIAAAPVAESIKRTVTEQAVEFLAFLYHGTGSIRSPYD